MGRKTCRGLIALGLLGCLTAHAASPVWAIHGDHNTVYLAGSVHLLKANDSALPTAFERAYTGSHTLIMEIDLGKVDPMAAATWMAGHGMLPDGTDLKTALGAARYQRVSTEATRLGMPMEMVGQFAPWVLGLQLMDMQYAKDGFDSESGVEQQLEHRAQTDGKATVGLETLEEQLGFFEALTPDQQAKFLDLVLNDLHTVDTDTQEVVAAGVRAMPPNWRRCLVMSTSSSRRSTARSSPTATSAGSRSSRSCCTTKTITLSWWGRYTSSGTGGCWSCCGRMDSRSNS